MKIVFFFSFLITSFGVQAFDSEDFSVWLDAFKQEAKIEHISSKTIKGKAYFTSWSANVKVEGLNVCRHIDQMTHNHK